MTTYLADVATAIWALRYLFAAIALIVLAAITLDHLRASSRRYFDGADAARAGRVPGQRGRSL